MSRLREEAGMTLMELITAISVGMIVMLAMFTLLDNTVRMNTNAMAKTDAMQRGRLAMDVMTQELRSQVCLENLAGPAIVPGATSDTVEFYSDFSSGDGTVPPTKRKLSFDRATGNVKTSIYTTAKLEPLPSDFGIAPTYTQLRLEHAALQRNAANQEIPFLSYYAYRWTGNPPRPEASEVLVPPIDANEARRVARIDVTLVAQPLGNDDRTKGVNITDQIMARHSDPNLAKWDATNPTLPDPRCV